MRDHLSDSSHVARPLPFQIAVGRPAIVNSDLVTRCEQGADENEGDQASVYGGGERGYTDYPVLQG